jgi:hypothetical protein
MVTGDQQFPKRIAPQMGLSCQIAMREDGG